MTGLSRTTTTSAHQSGVALRTPHRRLPFARLGLPLVGFLVFAFLYLPILVLILFSFNSGTKIGQWEGFSLQWFQVVFQSRPMKEALQVSLWVAALSTVIS